MCNLFPLRGKKMRFAVAILGLLFLCPLTRADQVELVDVSAVDCVACVSTPFAPPPNLPNIDLQLQFTVETVTGTFLYPVYDITETMTVDEVLSMTGTFNGNTVTLAPPGQGDGDWLYTNLDLGWICFTAAGEKSCMGSDDANNLLSNSVIGSVPITWTAAVVTPEPTTLLLAEIGIVIVFVGFGRYSRRKFRDAP
jgi:hypothetical protein